MSAAVAVWTAAAVAGSIGVGRPVKKRLSCPVLALKTLKALQKEEGMYDGSNPVFRFGNGSNLTQSQFNQILSSLLPDLCKKGENTISCHSFRAGIPSTLSLFPHLATSDMVKGWGRWHSDCFTKYTRLKLQQKEQIFSHIAGALHSVVPSPGENQ